MATCVHKGIKCILRTAFHPWLCYLPVLLRNHRLQGKPIGFQLNCARMQNAAYTFLAHLKIGGMEATLTLKDLLWAKTAAVMIIMMHALMFLSIQQKAIVQLGSCMETNLLKTEIGNPNHSRTATGNRVVMFYNIQVFKTRAGTNTKLQCAFLIY